ncbi:hypothetical protein Moror_16797 [Moniliophthora roreri MCA 2997]|uniref:Uncharacterized protein n=1 Tax=Moniliophthora roreri (strain MCA 2997) TaxID=1381753 RepID=V2X7T3_MONRO|nr:hypothetical protein Moror_16797 [Moniliophthora roreri MCA 2997]
MEITNTRDVAISGNATLSVVRRDQYNQTINAQVVHIGRSQRAMGKQEQKKRDSDPEYKQYREIIRGDIYKVEELVENIWDCEWKDDGLHVWSCRRTVHQARLYGDGKVFTAFSYHGADALKAWKKDFVKYSRTNDPAILFQLFGINRSKVPALLFYDDWLPLGHLFWKKSFWERFYLVVHAHAWSRQRVGLFSFQQR